MWDLPCSLPISKKEKLKVKFFLLALFLLVISFSVGNNLGRSGVLNLERPESSPISIIDLFNTSSTVFFANLFVNNLTVILVLFLGRLFFGIPTLVFLFLNGIVNGFMISPYLVSHSSLEIFRQLSIHSVELIAVLMAGEYGLRGLNDFRKKKQTEDSWFSFGSLVQLMACIIFTAIGAYLEVFYSTQYSLI